jgi:hypothetical protein
MNIGKTNVEGYIDQKNILYWIWCLLWFYSLIQINHIGGVIVSVVKCGRSGVQALVSVEQPSIKSKCQLKLN